MITAINLSAQTVTIPIATANNVLLLQTDCSNRLRTVYFGKPLENESEYAVVSANYNYDEANSGELIYTPSYY
jgi:alpha-galactosidase